MTKGGSTGVFQGSEGARKAQHFGAEEPELGMPRLAGLDGDIDADRRRSRTPPKRKRRRGSHPGIPSAVRKEITRAAHELNRQYRKLFQADPKLKDRVARLLRSMLPPKVKRGRPGIPSVTTAIRLLNELRHLYPQDRAAELWKRVYPAAIPGYDALSPIEQRTAREVLRERVRWRRRARLPYTRRFSGANPPLTHP